MYLERTIWPIGHGAFYTEQFKDDHDNVLFTAVYDCGSEQTKMLVRCIDDIFPSRTRNCIDALFISHFHNDHVNGLKELLNHCCIRQLFIPQLTQEYLLYTLCSIATTRSISERNDIVNFLYRLYRGEIFENIEVVYEVPTLSPGDIRRDGADLRPEISNEILNRTHNIAPPIIRGFAPEWIYIPFNLHSSNPDLIDAFYENEDYVTNNRLDFYKIFMELKAGNWKRIQAIYSKVWKDKHNEYSMPVFSGLMSSAERNNHPMIECDVYGMHCYRNFCRDCHHCVPCSIRFYRENLINCLYTGDFEPTDGHISAMRIFYQTHQNAWERIGLLQVPHHGSKENYADDLYDFPKLAFMSAAINDRYRHPSLFTIRNILSHDCFPIVIKNREQDICMFKYHFI